MKFWSYPDHYGSSLHVCAVQCNLRDQTSQIWMQKSIYIWSQESPRKSSSDKLISFSLSICNFIMQIFRCRTGVYHLCGGTRKVIGGTGKSLWTKILPWITTVISTLHVIVQLRSKQNVKESEFWTQIYSNISVSFWCLLPPNWVPEFN